MSAPQNPKIYHIVHADRLPSIVGDGCLWCDAVMNQRARPGTIIGMSGIKQRRLVLPLTCHPGNHVGDYVPFYFCPRSVMLFVIHCANHPELTYRGGQGPIVHLEADLEAVVAWAEENGIRWAFSLSNAGAAYTQFRDRLDQLGELNWDAIEATDFRQADVKEGKQAEFLLHGSFPWELVTCIGVRSTGLREQVQAVLEGANHQPIIRVKPGWYF
jgi:hypothetical protein